MLLAQSCLGIAAFTGAQQINAPVYKTGEKPSIAVPDFRGSGDAQKFMGTFNSTLFNDLETSGQLKMIAKTLYPVQVPQQPSDFRPPVNGQSQGLGSRIGPDRRPTPTTSRSATPPCRTTRSFSTVGSSMSAKPIVGSAQLIGKVYLGSLDEAGARKVAQEFAADILKQFGATSLIGTRIYFVSDRTGHKEIWSMNYDGSDQKQFTNYRSITTFPAVSPGRHQDRFHHLPGACLFAKR